MDVRVKGCASHALQCIATQFCSNARHEHAAGKREGVQSGAGLVVEAARGASARALARHLLLALRAHASRLPELGLAEIRLLAVALHLGLVLRRKLRRRLLLLLAHALRQEPAAQRSAGAADNTRSRGDRAAHSMWSSYRICACRPLRCCFVSPKESVASSLPAPASTAAPTTGCPGERRRPLPPLPLPQPVESTLSPADRRCCAPQAAHV